jgi:hypothetical protein
MNQSRRPSGTPVGGQFAPISRPAAGELGLSDDDDAPTTPGAHLSELGRDERIAALRNEIDRAMKDLSSPEGWTAFLESRSKFHRYSLNNAFLIYHQKPDATDVAGFNDWKNKHGRSVKKGERAIWILAPLTRKVEVEQEGGGTASATRVVGFRAVPVFDVSQTDGPPLPERPRIDAGELGDAVPDGMVEELTGFIASRGFSISRGDTGDAGGWTNFGTNQVVISDKATDAEAARTLAHEAAHIALEHGAGHPPTTCDPAASGRRWRSWRSRWPMSSGAATAWTRSERRASTTSTAGQKVMPRRSRRRRTPSSRV